MRQLKISTSITNRESQSLTKYFLEVNKLELISPEEEAQLAALIKKGDKKAIDRLVEANLRFVISVAKQFQYQGLSLPDLINEGNIGLMKAARSFDPSRGFKFISYAVWWIRQHIMFAIAEKAHIIRMPRNKMILRRHIQKASSLLEQKLERSASEEELAEQLNIDVKEITIGLGVSEKFVSLDSPLSEDEENSMLDVLENQNAVSTDRELNYTVSLKTEIDRLFLVLSERQKETLRYFFGIGMDHPLSLEDIARKLYITTERARQIKDKAIEKLRTDGNISLLRSFLAA